MSLRFLLMMCVLVGCASHQAQPPTAAHTPRQLQLLNHDREEVARIRIMLPTELGSDLEANVEWWLHSGQSLSPGEEVRHSQQAQVEVHASTIRINLNPQMADHNHWLTLAETADGLRGEWSFAGFAGLTPRGPVREVR